MLNYPRLARPLNPIHRIALAAIALALMAAFTNAATPPNILLIQVDDLGYDDLSIHDNQTIATPHLDRLGFESTQFRNFYVQSVCAPTRAALLTGRHFLKAGVSGVHGGRDFINLDETLISERLKAAGYQTGMWGKWHSGKTDGYFPWDRGFDEAYMAYLYDYYDNEGHLNGKPHPVEGWSCARITDFAIDFVQRQREHPFFAYVSYMSPHSPWEAPEEYIQPHLDAGRSKAFATLAGMVEFLDSNIGRLLDSVREAGLLENTVVVFISDNGAWTSSYNVGALPADEWALRNPHGFRGNKGTNLENGVKSPLFVRLPGPAKPQVRYELLKIEDLFPTLLELAGQDSARNPKPLDGMSFAKLLGAKPDAEWPERTLFFAQWNPEWSQWPIDPRDRYQHHIPLNAASKGAIRFNDQRIAIRDERHKLVLLPKEGEPIEDFVLTDLWTDPREQTNLYSKDNAVSTSLKAELEQWYQSVLSDPSTYTMPRFQIGWQGNPDSNILAYAPFEITDGLVNRAHDLTGWSKVGQYARYHIDVNTPGTYQVSLHATSVGAKNTRIRISMDGVSIESSLENGDKDRFPIGQLTFGKHNRELTIELISTPENQNAEEPIIGEMIALELTRL